MFPVTSTTPVFVPSPALGQFHDGAVHPRHQVRVGQPLLVVGDRERLRFPLGSGFEAVGEATVSPTGPSARRYFAARASGTLDVTVSVVNVICLLVLPGPIECRAGPPKRLVPHGLPCR